LLVTSAAKAQESNCLKHIPMLRRHKIDQAIESSVDRLKIRVERDPERQDALMNCSQIGCDISGFVGHDRTVVNPSVRDKQKR
jgi:hypothetical protein